MEMLEIILLVGGVLCIIASFFIGGKSSDEGDYVKADAGQLSEQDREHIRQQIDELIEEQISDVTERTEASLDKISNTKIMEMNDYAETVISEINRNHNETVFLYDMLNEKAKEVKSTVKDVNIAKKEVAQAAKAQSMQMSEHEDENAVGKGVADAPLNKSGDRRDLAKERLIEQVKKSAERSNQMQAEVNAKSAGTKSDAEIGVRQGKNKNDMKSNVIKEKLQEQIAQIKNNSNATKNDIIIAMHNLGMSNKDVAKELNLGVGEVKLVIDLYSSSK